MLLRRGRALASGGRLQRASSNTTEAMLRILERPPQALLFLPTSENARRWRALAKTGYWCASARRTAAACEAPADRGTRNIRREPKLSAPVRVRTAPAQNLRMAISRWQQYR